MKFSMKNMKSYYEGKYNKIQVEKDLERKNRLYFCFPSNMRNKKVVSIGSGPGVDIKFLVAKNEVHAIDISEKVLSMARSLGMHTHSLDLNNIKQLPFEDQSVDIVVATDILEHLFDPLKLLIEARRILKENGFAIFSVPNHFFWSM